MDQHHNNGSTLSSLENAPITESLAAVSSDQQANMPPIACATDPNLSPPSSDKESTEGESSAAEKEEEDSVRRLTTDRFMPSPRNTGEKQTSDHREKGSSNPSKDSSGVLKDMFTLMKEVVQTLTCIQKSMKEEIQKMTSVLCEETKHTHGLLENILKELQGQHLNADTRIHNVPDNNRFSEDCYYRDVSKKLEMCHPLEKYYREVREASTEHSQNAESREVSATIVAVNQTPSESRGFENFQHSESTLNSRETDSSHITNGVINSLSTAQNNPLERKIGDSEKNIAEMTAPSFPVSKNYVEVSGIRIKGGPDVELQHLHDALARARLPDPLSSPRARSYDTVLCLDTSESMNEGGAFEQMVNIVNQFVDGVEDVVTESGSEENISVVTFGGQADVAQHLTNDFSRVRDAIERIEVGGSSPFYDAFLVALAALEKKGGMISLSGEYEIRPRIIFISDGHATGYEKHSAWDRPRDHANVRAPLIRLLSDIKPSESCGLPHPIVFVPVGTKADRNFMSSLATLNGSMMVEPENITSLCRYFKIQEAVGKTIVCLGSKTSEAPEQIQAVVRALVSDLHPNEEEEVIEKVQLELDKSSQKKRPEGKPTDFYNVFEDTDGVMSGDRLPLGTRVTKGPDWTWGNQGGGGPGTVVQHENRKHSFTWVWWDTGEYNRYPYGPDMGFHIWKTEEHPRIKLLHDPLNIGMIVKKGHSLENLETIRNATKGVIIRRSQDRKRLKVRWDNGIITECKINAVVYCDILTESEEKFVSLSEELFGHRLGREVEENVDAEEDDANKGDKKRVWQWKDESGNWRLYPEDLAERIEKEFNRRHGGTLAFTRGGKNYRVKLKQMIETSTSSGTSRDIQRVLLPLDEYLSLKTAEELTQ